MMVTTTTYLPFLHQNPGNPSAVFLLRGGKEQRLRDGEVEEETGEEVGSVSGRGWW